MRILSILTTIEGWRYLLSKPYNDDWCFRIMWCRLMGHPSGIVFYRAYGDEPDRRCKDCGEDIG